MAASTIDLTRIDVTRNTPAPRLGVPSHAGTAQELKELADNFARDGYASIDALTTPQDLLTIRGLLDPLFERFDSLGERALDLAGPGTPGAALKSPEVNEAVSLEPALRDTHTFKRCRAIARHLLGVPVGYQFDHAIFKPPHNKTPTAWHQDEAYNTAVIPLKSIHFWIPLQPVTVENGCMWFVPGSHRGPLLEHTVISKRAKGGTLAASGVDLSQGVACPLALGAATIHHPMTLHYTGANDTDHHRRAWILHFGAFGQWRYRLHPKNMTAKLFGWIPGARML